MIELAPLDEPVAAAIGWFYLATNSARVLTYVPQIVAVWRCTDGARAISLLTWGSWMIANVTAVAYGVLVGEVVAPILLILGVLTRPAALVLAFTMVVAWLMVGLDKTVALDKTGAWAIESLVYFFVAALAIAFLGAGKYALGGKSAWQ